MSNIIIGKENVIQAFKGQYQLYPLWKIFDITNTKVMVAYNLSDPDKDRSLNLLNEKLNTLVSGNVYTLWLYRHIDSRKAGQAFSKPNLSFHFQIEKAQSVQGINENMDNHNIPKPNPYPQPQYNPNPYGVNPSQQIGLHEHIMLIQGKAKAESEVEYMKNLLADQVKQIADLERTNKKLQETIEELEEELEELEAEQENEEIEKAKEEAIKGTAPSTLESTISKLVQEHGGVIIENAFGKKGVQGGPTFEETNEPGEKDNLKVSGISDTNIDSLTIQQLNDEMLKLNPKWKKHLYKMILIGEQKPLTFKAFMYKLETF